MKDDEALAEALGQMAMAGRGTQLPPASAQRCARLLRAAAQALDAAVPGSLFDTEPAGLSVLLESSAAPEREDPQ